MVGEHGKKRRRQAVLGLRWLDTTGDHLSGFANSCLQQFPRNLENEQSRTAEKCSGIGEPWIEQRDIARLQQNLAAILLESQLSPNLPADENLVDGSPS